MVGDYTNEADDPDAAEPGDDSEDEGPSPEMNNNRSMRNFSHISEELETIASNDTVLDESDFIQLRELSPRSRAPVTFAVQQDQRYSAEQQQPPVVHEVSGEQTSQIRERSGSGSLRPASDTVVRRPSSIFTDNRVHPVSLQIPPFRRTPSSLSSRSSRPQSLVDVPTSEEQLGRSGEGSLFQNSSNGHLDGLLQSIELKRAISAYEEKADSERVVKTHRRTQSHIPPGVVNKPSGDLTDRGSVLLRRNRNSIRSTAREYYAAESFTEASLVQRQESVMKQQEVLSFIQ